MSASFAITVFGAAVAVALIVGIVLAAGGARRRPRPVDNSVDNRSAACVDLARLEMDRAAWESAAPAKLRRAQLAHRILSDGFADADEATRPHIAEELERVERYIEKLHERLDPEALADEPEARLRRRAAPAAEADLVASLQSGRLRRTLRQRQRGDRIPREPVLVADIEAEGRAAVRASLETVGAYEVVSVGDCDELWEALATERYRAAVVAERLLGPEAVERDRAFAELRERFPRVRVVLICNEEPTYKARRALRAKGAFECIARPVEHYGLSSIVDRALAEPTPESAP